MLRKAIELSPFVTNQRGQPRNLLEVQIGSKQNWAELWKSFSGSSSLCRATYVQWQAPSRTVATLRQFQEIWTQRWRRWNGPLHQRLKRTSMTRRKIWAWCKWFRFEFLAGTTVIFASNALQFCMQPGCFCHSICVFALFIFYCWNILETFKFSRCEMSLLP